MWRGHRRYIRLARGLGRLQLIGATAAVALIVSGCTSARPAETTNPIKAPEEQPVGPMVGYVKITWDLQVDVDCQGRETVDNGGFDSAVIEVWGPTPDGRFRSDITAPNGQVETVIVDLAADGSTIRNWSTHPSFDPSTMREFGQLTVFRNVECVEQLGNNRESQQMTSPPYSPGHVPFADLVPTSKTPRIDFLAVLAEIATETRTDTWNGTTFDVYVLELDATGRDARPSQSRIEYWKSRHDGLIQRFVAENNSSGLGSSSTFVEFVERSERSLDSVNFSTAGLSLGPTRRDRDGS